MIQFSIRFPTTQETAYQQARFLEYRQFSIAVGIAAMVLVLALWLRDYASDPVGARHTFHLRLLMDIGVALYVAALWLKAARWAMLASGYVAILTIEFGVLAVWGNLVGGYAGGFPGYMYIYLITPLVLLPFSFRESATLHLLIAVVPNLQVALGMAPGFPTLAFNALIWPACAIAVFAQSQFDQLFRRLFLSQVRLNELATLDSVTGLPNRLLFNDRLNQAISLAKRDSRQFALLFLDLDKFKQVNDTLGHPAGDELLRAVATRIRQQGRESDTVARLGGDEFAVILPGIARREEVETVANKIIAALATPFHLGKRKQSVEIGVSIGIAIYPPDARDANALVTAADTAMYNAKQVGSGFQFCGT